ncbi:protein Niban 1a [Esox lucius]|uniref:Niban 1/2/3 domain-containing protein n=1 Tax=Esox lucius TaxID=8010 RepID=A0A3P8Z001_ESOLU|nr:protein Niban 1a [Esox lucius]
MGATPSSLLDENTSNYIRDCAEATLKEFSHHYRRQHPVAFFSHIRDELEQQKEKKRQLLKQKAPPKSGKVLYEEHVLLFDDTRKWKPRYMVARANYSLECHDSIETFIKGSPPRHTLLPTGGAVLTTEEKYMAMVDECFPVSETSDVNEEFAPPVTGMPGKFPVYLRLPYRRDYYFCFRREERQAAFLSILFDCIRHQNQDFLKKKAVDVQAFLKAIQLYRQEKGFYDSWNMLIGSYVRVLANLVMEDLLPSLKKEVLPCLKVKKAERKRFWFAIVEEAYILVQEHLLVGLSALKEECMMATKEQEVLMRSDMDQILNSRTYLEGKLQASVLEPAEKFCAECVQPYLASVLEELMGPISSGFQEARVLTDMQMEQLCQDFQEGIITDDLKQALADMRRPNMLECYQRINSLHDQLHNLQERFGFSNIDSLVHSAQIDLQQLVENAAYTFELLFYKAIEEHPDDVGSATEKSRHMVLKQYDYDSSTVRKKIFQEALVVIALPHIKKNMAPTCKTELQGLEQFIYADYSNFVHVENIYEDILLQCLVKEVSKVVKEAASLKKHNLLTDSRDLLSRSSQSILKSASSSPSSPARGLGYPRQMEAKSGAEELESLEASTGPDASPVEKLVEVENRVGKPVACETKTKILDTPITAEEGTTAKQPVATETVEVQTQPSAETEETPAQADGVKPEETVVADLRTTVAQNNALSPSADTVPDPSNVPVHVVSPVAAIDAVAMEDLVAEGIASLAITTGWPDTDGESGPLNSDPAAPPGGVTVTPEESSRAATSETKYDDEEWDTENESGVKVCLSCREMEGSKSESPVGIAAKPPAEVSEGDPFPPNMISKATGRGDREASSEVTVANIKVIPPRPQPDTQATFPSDSTKENLQAGEPTEPVPRTLDCVKEIRNLVMEVSEVKEMV